MQWHLLWYALAGLILGLTASTLWEWLHFRRKRMELRDRRVLELETELRLLQQQNQELMQLVPRSTPPATDYQSPAVFLESEEAESLRDVEYTPQYNDVQYPAPVAEAVIAETVVVEETRYITPDAATLASGPDAEPEFVRDVEIVAAVGGEDDAEIDEGVEAGADENVELVSEGYRTVQSSESPISTDADAGQTNGEDSI